MNTRTGIVPALGARVAAHGAALAEAAQGRWLFTPGRERARPPHRHRSASPTLPGSGPVWVVVWERPPAMDVGLSVFWPGNGKVEQRECKSHVTLIAI